MPKILEKNKLMMREHVGEADREGETFKLSTSLHGAPVIQFEDGAIVYWTWQELVERAIELKRQSAATDYQ
ncbi:hypothetical protein M3638_03055 [Oceanobacillus profundus]|uniref:hypothetical protein n=1 Tax=Oceanobacillus profundus TaxID=372463 RepID=UPI00203EC859|nr:hypothetical protein [Oceanobacillus profundus]MCM3396818.1 hypothetical protein [Oceanobacillus profundus]